MLAPCALEQVITPDNADKIRAKVICEGANGPTTPAADDILEERGILVLPDVLANAGGVVVSYFEWVQGLQEYFWKENEVNARLNDIMTRAFNETWQTMAAHKTSMRIASYGLLPRHSGNADHALHPPFVDHQRVVDVVGEVQQVEVLLGRDLAAVEHRAPDPVVKAPPVLRCRTARPGTW